jgi:RimJ/RimL family protein N-acetyltransferase
VTVERVRIEGERVVLRPVRLDEFEDLWADRHAADRSVLPVAPDRNALWARVERSGVMRDGTIDLAIEGGGQRIGEIQTYVPTTRPLPAGTFELGIGIDERYQGQGYGTEAVRLFVGWLFTTVDATSVQMATVEANVAMRTVLDRLGFTALGTSLDHGQEFVLYAVTRAGWTQ